MADTSRNSQQGDQRLYGRPGADELEFDIDTAIERYLDDYYDEALNPGDIVCFVMEEWSVHPPRYHMPSTSRLLEWVDEWTADNGEVGEGYEIDASGAAREAAEAFLDAFAATVTYRMADKRIAEWAVDATLGADDTWSWTYAPKVEVAPQ